MPLLQIDDDVYEYLLRRAVRIGEDGSSILRRELQLPAPSTNGAAPDADEAEAAEDGTDRSDELLAFLSSPLYRGNVTRRYLRLLSFLAKQHGEEFERVFSVKGRHRIYFANTEREIGDSGTSLHPQRIPETSYWAMTNADTFQKRDIIGQVLRVLGYPAESVTQVLSVFR